MSARTIVINVPINFGMREILGLAVFFAERFANDIYKRLKPYLTTAKANAAKTGSFNPNILEKVCQKCRRYSTSWKFDKPSFGTFGILL